QREYKQDAQVCVIMPLLEGTDGVQKMSKSLGNYIGINEPPSEIFGKVMSISDELMWRYYELLTDLTAGQIAALKNGAEKGERNPRDIKAELAKSIISDFYSSNDAQSAEEEFNRIFRRNEVPAEIEEVALQSGVWKLPRLLVDLKLAPSMAEARRLIEQGGVYLDGERKSDSASSLSINSERFVLIQIGKRKFVRVRGVG
ncbi:MAG TPA: tyrosine--tRNA ligase, partial [Pyrinomonadaceae bacterium]|nr:tyrosine--tRNA ligase [Pyrinomonadaceae bacterium]